MHRRLKLAADTTLRETAVRDAALVWREGMAPPAGMRLVTGTAGDHAAVQQFFGAMFSGAWRDAFPTSLEDPFYEPNDRQLIYRGSQIVGHVGTTRRVTRFGSLELPTAGLHALGTLPEFRGYGYGRALLRAIERATIEDGTQIGILRTRIPHFFRSSGWAVCGRHSRARVSTRGVLSQLSARGIPPAEGGANIRPWRQVELASLMQCYADCTRTLAGAAQRTEAYWRWLIARRAYDRILVAVDGPDKFDLEQPNVPIAGYVVAKEDCVLELIARDTDTPAGAAVAGQLLARAGGEAIERDYHSIDIHLLPRDRLLGLCREAGGDVEETEAHAGEVFMIKLFQGVQFLQTLAPELIRRLTEAGLQRIELGLAIENERFQLTVTRRGVKIESAKMGRSYLRLNEAEFTRLALGHLDVAEAVASRRIEASTRTAIELASVLFPRVPLWRSPWDELFG